MNRHYHSYLVTIGTSVMVLSISAPLAVNAAAADGATGRPPLPVVVRLDAGQNAPLGTLAAGLRRSPKAPLLRVVWYGSAMLKGTALYDRRRHTLAYYFADAFPELKGYFKESATYARVTDRILVRAAKDHRDVHNALASADFETLPQYGCKRIHFVQKRP